MIERHPARRQTTEGALSQLALPLSEAVEPVEPVPPVLEFVRHPRARRYILRVAADGTVRVTIPRWGSRRDARAFADRERDWIEKQQGVVREIVPAVVPRELRERARRELPQRLMELAREQGLAVRRVSVRNQKWRWGSCSRGGHICLNWRLVQLPEAVRDYVMIHELMHLRRMDHSPRFWRLVGQACPGYQEMRAFLRSHPLS